MLSHNLVVSAVRNALAEDLGLSGDITTNATIPAETRSEAVLATRSRGIVSGLALAEAAFRELDPNCSFDVEIDVTEWLGNEQYAFVPFEATPEISAQLAELASELDSEQLRTQICVELDPLSRVRSGDKATLWLDAERLHLFDPHSGDNLTRVTESRGRHAATAG